MRPERPFLSVIVPAHNAQQVLPACLEALAASDVPRECWELIVVDDASTDETAIVAARHADAVVRLLGKPHGPAFGRNRGFEASRGEVIVFVDADVVAHSDALRRIIGHFIRDPHLAAVFGSYDAHPPAPGLISQYRNLLHHYVHQRNRGPAETFWAGLGAIRREAFAGVGRFDEWHYARPQIEDIELGRRLRRFGRRILLDPSIQGAHLKRWTFRTMVATDFQHRGVPWMWLMLQEGEPGGGTLNVRRLEKLCTALAALALLGLVVAPLAGRLWPLLGAAAAVAVVLLLNAGFYRFMERERGFSFALAILPLHVGYYVVNGFSVVFGWLVHNLFGEPIPPPEVEAIAQRGVAIWPPAPKPSTSVWSLPRAGSDEEAQR